MPYQVATIIAIIAVAYVLVSTVLSLFPEISDSISNTLTGGPCTGEDCPVHERIGRPLRPGGTATSTTSEQLRTGTSANAPGSVEKTGIQTNTQTCSCPKGYVRSGNYCVGKCNGVLDKNGCSNANVISCSMPSVTVTASLPPCQPEKIASPVISTTTSQATRSAVSATQTPASSSSGANEGVQNCIEIESGTCANVEIIPVLGAIVPQSGISSSVPCISVTTTTTAQKSLSSSQKTSTTTTTKPAPLITGTFTENSFTCSKVSGGIYCNLDYTNGLGTTALAIILFTNTDGEVVTNAVMFSQQGSGTNGALFYCNSFPRGNYFASWKVYGPSDADFTNAAAWSTIDERQQFTC